VEAIIHIRCEGCRAALVIVPPSVSEAAEDRDDDLEEVTGIEGERFALADDAGRYTCPECGRSGRAPRLNFS
jgi:hypothetical protein